MLRRGSPLASEASAARCDGGHRFFQSAVVKWSRDGQPQAIYGFLILLGLTLICNWVAFGSGERHFSSKTSLNGATVASRPVDERNGRLVFGIAAVILDLMVVASVARLVRQRSRRRVEPT